MALTESGRKRTRVGIGLLNLLLVCCVGYDLDGRQSPDEDMPGLQDRLIELEGRVFFQDQEEGVLWGVGNLIRFSRADFRQCAFEPPLDEMGRYSVRLTPGEWRLYALVPDGGSMADIIAPGQSREVDVQPPGDDSRQRFDVELRWAGPARQESWLYSEMGRIQGQVDIESPDGRIPFRLGSFLLQRLDFTECIFEVKLDADGRFRMGILSGRYRIIPSGQLDGLDLGFLPGQSYEVDVPGPNVGIFELDIGFASE